MTRGGREGKGKGETNETADLVFGELGVMHVLEKKRGGLGGESMFSHPLQFFA